MTEETMKGHCFFCEADVQGKVLRSSDGRPEGVFYDCPVCNRESVLVTWGRSGECP